MSEGAKYIKGSAPSWWLLGQQVGFLVHVYDDMVHWVAPAAVPTTENTTYCLFSRESLLIHLRELDICGR